MRDPDRRAPGRAGALLRSAVAYVRLAPGTFAYLAVVTGTALWLAASRVDVDAFLRGRSSNLAALDSSPPHGLLQSAFFVDGWPMLAGAIALGVALAPAERWLGTARWLAVLAIGHIATSLAVAAAIWAAIDLGDASPGLRRMVDVGVSYGFAAVAGVFAHRLRGRWRLAYVAGIALALSIALAVDRSFTDLGHLLAFGVGLACLPLVPARRRFRSLPVVERPRAMGGSPPG